MSTTQLPKLPSFEYIAENALLLTWPAIICEQQHQHIMACQQAIEQTCQAYLIESVASYNSLLVYYQFNAISINALQATIKKLLTHITTASDKLTNTESNLIEIPVCYHPSVATDLIAVSEQTGLTIEEIIQAHSSHKYRAYALGFTPGFCYLATLPKELQLPRKKIPALKVPKGSVAIAGQQTAVYPDQSPGGWHIIGQTPMAMYQTTTQHFTPAINVGDIVTFKAISLANYQQLCEPLDKSISEPLN